jgi:signal peptidase I
MDMSTVQTSTGEQAGRNPWVAVALAMMAPGLGHIYAGEIVKGLAYFFGVLLFAPAVAVAGRLPASWAVLAGLLLTVLAILGLYLYSVVDAYRVARRRREHYPLRDYNRGLVYVLFLLASYGYVVGAVLFLRSNSLEAFYLPTDSMAPTLLVGDHVLVTKLPHPIDVPERGDVLVFYNPENTQQRWIKRVIALPGDKVATRGGDVFVNGKKLERDPVPAESLAAIRNQVHGDVFVEHNAGRRYTIMFAADGKQEDFPEKEVPRGCVFVLGDHRDNSRDSRDPEFGFVPLGNVLGRVRFIEFPAETWARFGVVQD